jgi:hypothetical protein
VQCRVSEVGTILLRVNLLIHKTCKDGREALKKPNVDGWRYIVVNNSDEVPISVVDTESLFRKNGGGNGKIAILFQYFPAFGPFKKLDNFVSNVVKSVSKNPPCSSILSSPWERELGQLAFAPSECP